MNNNLGRRILLLAAALGATYMAHGQPATQTSSQNRLAPIPVEDMSEPLRRALAEYSDVRPDGLAQLGGVGAAGEVGAGDPNLWTVYVHLPEILGPIRQLHEQVHVNPRISQKLVHFIIMVVARHWTNDIMFGEEGVVQTAVTVGLYSYLSLAVNMAYPESATSGRLAPFPQ